MLLELPADAARRDFDRRAFTLRHRLVDHPLLALDRLIDLARALPAEEIEYNPGDLPVHHDPALTPSNGLSAEETLRRIRDCKSWLVLKRVERDPAYRGLLDDCLAEVRRAVGGVAARMHQGEAFVFVSSPGAVTPFHMDPEHNFLLQIRGAKSFHVWDPADRDVISERALERYFSSSEHRNLEYRDEFARRGRTIELGPGDGVHVPMAAPHWVANGADVSISLSITFRSERSNQRQRLYQINARLRRLGLTPTAVGRRPALDAFKLRADRVYARLSVAFRLM